VTECLLCTDLAGTRKALGQYAQALLAFMHLVKNLSQGSLSPAQVMQTSMSNFVFNHQSTGVAKSCSEGLCVLW